MPKGFEAIWEEIVEQSPLPVPDGLGGRLATYRDELARWNRKINLIRYQDDRELASRHFLDSLAALEFLPQGASVLDIGSGAGFPGCVMAIARPDLRVKCVESISKKANFLRQLARTIPIDNLDVIHGRAEDLKPGIYDIITGRAVAAPAQFVRMALCPVKAGGRVMIWLSENDVNDLRTDYEFEVKLYELPGESRQRAVAVITAPARRTVPSA